MNEGDIKIEQVSNGFIVSYMCVDCEEIPYVRKELFTDDKDEYTKNLPEDNISGYKLLHAIMEHFCFGGSKHDKARIQIEIEQLESE